MDEISVFLLNIKHKFCDFWTLIHKTEKFPQKNLNIFNQSARLAHIWVNILKKYETEVSMHVLNKPDRNQSIKFIHKRPHEIDFSCAF